MATPTRGRQLIDGVWQNVTFDEDGGGGSLPDPVTDPVNIAVDSDVVGLTVTAPAGGSANLIEVNTDNPNANFAVDSFGRFVQQAFNWITTAAAPSGMALVDGASFEVDNDDTGDPILKVTAGTPNTVEINGVAYSGTGFPVSLGDDDDVRIVSSADPTTLILFKRAAGALAVSSEFEGDVAWRLGTDGVIRLASPNPFILDAAPEVPAIPTPQDIVDALVTLGLVTQA